MPEKTKIKEAKKQKNLEKRDEDWISPVLDLEYFILNPHLLPVEIGPQTKRVSVLIGDHQPIGIAQTRRVIIPIGSQLFGKTLRFNASSYGMAVTLFMAMRSSSWILTRASMATKQTSLCDGVHLFVISATCLVTVRDV